MNEIENSNILLFSSINIYDIKEILNYYMMTWNEPKNYITNKDFYLDLKPYRNYSNV